MPKLTFHSVWHCEGGLQHNFFPGKVLKLQGNMTGFKKKTTQKCSKNVTSTLSLPSGLYKSTFKALIVKFICGDRSHNTYEWGLYAFHVNPGSTSDVGNFSGIFLSSSAKRR